jgi:D-serine deaminase-like pyridoxal phosphate-dependent protein
MKNLQITEPTLILDKQKCLANISAMAEKAKRNNVVLRPHFKTHQSHEIGSWFRDFGVDRITVSSLAMAEYFAADDWKDITVAFPVNVLEIEKINSLASQIQLNLLVESVESIQALALKLQHKVGLFIKIDIGYHRTGIDPQNRTLIDAILRLVEQEEKMTFKGFLGHAGHSYKCRGDEEIRKVHESSKALMMKVKLDYVATYPNLVASIGDTPTCSRMDDFKGVDEIRPGNYVFYDLTQWGIGSCSLDQIAVATACPVVAKHPERSEIVVYGGGVHLAKDRAIFPGTDETYWGLVVQPEEDHWHIPNTESRVISLSQEHGIIRASQKVFDQTQIGDLLYILPIHSCMNANLMKAYTLLDGTGISRL